MREQGEGDGGKKGTHTVIRPLKLQPLLRSHVAFLYTEFYAGNISKFYPFSRAFGPYDYHPPYFAIAAPEAVVLEPQ